MHGMRFIETYHIWYTINLFLSYICHIIYIVCDFLTNKQEIKRKGHDTLLDINCNKIF